MTGPSIEELDEAFAALRVRVERRLARLKWAIERGGGRIMDFGEELDDLVVRAMAEQEHIEDIIGHLRAKIAELEKAEREADPKPS